MKIGLKLWSVNSQYIDEAVRLFSEDLYQYIELYALPGTYNDMIHKWKNLDIPFVIHAPHFSHGMNLSVKEREKSNLNLAYEAFRYADDLAAGRIIFHPGCNGTVDETIRQFRLLNDNRILVENKPAVSVDGKHICIGSTPGEIRMIIDATGYGFCLDIGHAVCAANSHGIDRMEMLKTFMRFEPGIYHLTDGDYDGIYDQHRMYGEGSFPIEKILVQMDPCVPVTNESQKDSSGTLNEFIGDCRFLRRSMGEVIAERLVMALAAEKDIDDVYRLSNKPDIRKYSFSMGDITPEEHRDWYGKIIADSNTFFLLFRYGKMIVGQVRFTINEVDSLVSVSIDPCYQDLGLGSRIMSMAVESLERKFPLVRTVRAQVISSNSRSVRYFEKNGFNFEQDISVKGISAKQFVRSIGL